MIRKIHRLNRGLLEAYLRENEVSLLPLAGNYWAEGLRRSPGRMRAGRYVLALREGRPVGVAAEFNDGNCMVFTREEEAARELAEYAERWYFHSVWCYGMTEKAAACFPVYAGDRQMVCLPHELWVRREIPAWQPPEGLVFSDARELTRDGKAVAFMQNILWECFEQRVSPDMIISRLKQREADEPHLLCMAGRRYVSQCHIQAWGKTAAHIGGVATLASARHRGYGRAVLEEICRYIAGKGRLPTLTVRRDNDEAMKMYENAGFRRLEPVWVWEVRFGD